MNIQCSSHYHILFYSKSTWEYHEWIGNVAGLHCVVLVNNWAKFKNPSAKHVVWFSLPAKWWKALSLEIWNRDENAVTGPSNRHTKKTDTYTHNRQLMGRCRHTHTGTCPSVCQGTDTLRHAQKKPLFWHHASTMAADSAFTYYPMSKAQANEDLMRAGGFSESSWCSSSTHSHHFFAQIFHSMTHFSLRNYTLLSVAALCFTCHHAYFTAANRLYNMLTECCVYMLCQQFVGCSALFIWCICTLHFVAVSGDEGCVLL